MEIYIEQQNSSRCEAPVHQQGEGQGVPLLQLVAASLLGLQNVAGLGAEEDGLRRGEGAQVRRQGAVPTLVSDCRVKI